MHPRLAQANPAGDRVGSLDLTICSPGTVVSTAVLPVTIGRHVVMSRTRGAIRIALVGAALGLASATCGSPPPRKPAPPPPPDAAPVVVAPAVDAAPPALPPERLCEMLVERTRAETEAAKPETLAVVAAHCLRWPTSVQQCLATADEQGPCMRELDPDLRTAFVTEIGATLNKAPTCEEIAAAPERWAPIPKEATGDARQRAALAIGDAIAASCAAWPEPIRHCTRDQSAPRTCLDQDVAALLDGELARRAALWKKAADFRSGSRKIKCKKVADAHYDRKAWVGTMADLSGADRKLAMRRSEDGLEDACKDEKWPAFTRGCVIAAKSVEERGWCIDIEKRWAYPAQGAVRAKKPRGGTKSTGFAGCDEYVAAQKAYVACTEITADERAAAQAELEAMTKAWRRVDDDDDDAAKAQDATCKAAAETLQTRSAAAGCDL
jgi:hypothetical protein